MSAIGLVLLISFVAFFITILLATIIISYFSYRNDFVKSKEITLILTFKSFLKFYSATEPNKWELKDQYVKFQKDNTGTWSAQYHYIAFKNWFEYRKYRHWKKNKDILHNKKVRYDESVKALDDIKNNIDKVNKKNDKFVENKITELNKKYPKNGDTSYWVDRDTGITYDLIYDDGKWINAKPKDGDFGYWRNPITGTAYISKYSDGVWKVYHDGSIVDIKTLNENLIFGGYANDMKGQGVM